MDTTDENSFAEVLIFSTPRADEQPMDLKDVVAGRVQGQTRYRLSPATAQIREASGGTLVVEGGELIRVAGPMQLEIVGEQCFAWCRSCGWKGHHRNMDERMRLNSDSAEHRCDQPQAATAE